MAEAFAVTLNVRRIDDLGDGRNDRLGTCRNDGKEGDSGRDSDGKRPPDQAASPAASFALSA